MYQEALEARGRELEAELIHTTSIPRAIQLRRELRGLGTQLDQLQLEQRMGTDPTGRKADLVYLNVRYRQSRNPRQRQAIRSAIARIRNESGKATAIRRDMVTAANHNDKTKVREIQGFLNENYR